MAFGQQQGPPATSRQVQELLTLLQEAVRSGVGNVNDGSYAQVKEFLATVSRSRALQGFSPTETGSSPSSW